MPDDKKSDEKYNTGGFSKDDNGIFANPDYKWDNVNDYESWDWKQIMAAVIGGSAMPPTGSGGTRIAGAIDPQTLYDASSAFAQAQAVLEMVATQLTKQAEALAGEHGAWQGSGATSFRNMMDILSVKVAAKAEQIAGGPSRTTSTPAQLFNSGNYLAWAQPVLRSIDNYYATWVAEQGRINNGLSTISAYPHLVEQMSNDMRQVIRTLAHQYTYTAGDIVQPDTSPFQDTPNSKDGPPPPKPPPTPDPPPPPKPPPSHGGGGGGGGGDDIGGPPPPKPPPPPPKIPLPDDTGGGGGGNPPSFNPGGGPGGGGLGSNNLLSDNGGAGGENGALPPPFDLGGDPGGGGSGGLNSNSLNGNGDIGALPPPATIPPFPGGPGSSNLLTNNGGKPPPPPKVPNPPGTGGGSGGGAAGGGAPPSLAVASPPGLGGGGTGGGVGGGAGGENGLPNTSAPPPLNPADWVAGDSDGTGGALDQRGGGGAPPMMPPGGGAGGGGQPNASERPDSAGLLGGEREAWETEAPPSVDLDSPSAGGGSQPPGSKPADWAVGGPDALSSTVDGPSGLDGIDGTGSELDSALAGNGSAMPPPMMPPGGGMGGGGQPGASERPDSAGLLGGERKSWETSDEPLNDPTGGHSRDKPAEWAVGGTPDAPGGPSTNGTYVPDTEGTDAPPPDEWNGGEESNLAALPGPGLVALPGPGGTPGSQVPAASGPVSSLGSSSGSSPSTSDSRRPAALPGDDRRPWVPVEPVRPGWAQEPVPVLSHAVPVVRPAESKQDTSAWDIGPVAFLPVIGVFTERDQKGEEVRTDHVLRSSEPWEDTGTGLQRWTPGEDSRFIPPTVHYCGADDAPPASEEPPEPQESDEDGAVDEDEQEAERVMADLLSQDNSAWTVKGPFVTKGVIE